MYWKNKEKKLLALLFAATMLVNLFPSVYAEDDPADGVTPVVQSAPEEVTNPADRMDPPAAPQIPEEPVKEQTGEPVVEHAPESDENPAEKLKEEITEEFTDKPAEVIIPEVTPEPTEEPAETPAPESKPDAIEGEITPNPDPIWDPTEDEDEPEEEEDGNEEEEYEELFEFDDDEVGFVSEELLEQFNNPDTFDHVEFCGTADIELLETTFSFGQTVTLVARVRDVDISYRLVWEASDGDERGWYTIGSGSQYSFTVTEDNLYREYRVILFTVD